MGDWIDNHGRKMKYLRLAVTDRCNLRCRYCMSAEGIGFAHRGDILTWQEMSILCRIFVELGIDKIRITGGEPFVRKGLIPFLSELGQMESGPEIAITTNGTLLSNYLDLLRRADIHRLNISLDTLNSDTFQAITRRSSFGQVVRGVNQAYSMGFEVKINVVVIPGTNDAEIPAFVELTRDRNWTVRFIEPMPFDGNSRQCKSPVNGDDILATIQECFDIRPLANGEFAIERVYRVCGFRGKIGIIYGFSRKFCNACSRLRVSAQGQMRTCLYGGPVLDLRKMLRSQESSEAIKFAIREAVGGRFRDGFRAERAGNQMRFDSMVAIGG